MPNFVIAVRLTHQIYWLIHRDDPACHDLLSLPGWSLINPLAYQGLIAILASKSPENSDSIALITDIEVRDMGIFMDQILIETRTLLFSTTFQESKQFNPEELNNYLDLFFMHLRQASKQFELTGIGITITITLTSESDNQNLFLFFPESSKKMPTISCRKYIFDTAIKWDQMKKADESLLSNELSVYNTLILDAIQAFSQRDFRRAILYATIAAESLAGSKLDEVYKSYLDNGDPTGTLRIITLQTRNDVVNKDPIYESLSNRTDFTQLIHELPLYLLRRSLLIEDNSLYNLAIKLYRTRNKIVHKGELPTHNPNDYLSLNYNGAVTALKCTIELFKWFGITEEYFLPEKTFIRLERRKNRSRFLGLPG